MQRVLKIALASAAMGLAAVPAQAVEVIGCGGGSSCLSGTTNVNLVSAENTALGTGTVGIGGPAVTFTTTEAGGLDLDASGQATISAGDEGTLTQLMFNIVTGFTGAEFSLNPLNVQGGPIQFGVSITTSAGGLFNFLAPAGNQRFAVLAGVGETLTSVTLSSTAGFGSFTQLRVGTGRNVGAVPEPGTWAMMLLGFGGIGYSLRRRRKIGTIAQLA